MRLSQLALKNTQFVLILVLIAILLGARSFIQMPRAEDPQVSLPIFYIVAVYPGTSPKDMEKLIVDPLEEAIDGISDISEIKSVIEEGVVSIRIEASYEIDSNDKFDEIVQEVSQVRGELPKGIVYFDIQQYKPEDLTIIQQYAFVSDLSPYSTLYDSADKLKGMLKAVDGIKKIEILAYPAEEINVLIDFQRLANLRISLNQIIQTLSTNNAIVPGGSVDAGNKTFSIKTTGGYKNIEEIRNTVIFADKGNIVYLKDVAQVNIGYENARWKARFNKEKAVWLTIKMKKGVNILQIAQEIKKIEAEFKQVLHPTIQLESAFQQAPAVEKRINDFFVNLLQGVLLVGLVILLFLGWRSAIIITLIIPLCIIIALAILSGSGYALQQISIGALVLALGLLVDNGIVVVENIKRYAKEGLSMKEAAAKGTSEVGFAVISSTATTLLSFFPLTQLGLGAGAFLRSLPVTVIITLVISLLLALTLSPILASKIMRPPKNNKMTLADQFFKWFTEKIYRPILKFSLRFGILLLIGAIGLLVFSISLLPAIGVTFFPTAEKPLLLIDVETPDGSNIEETNRAVAFVENILDTMDYVDNFSANVGHGNPQIYYNRRPVNYKSNKGQLMVNFKYWDATKFQGMLTQLRKDVGQYTNGTISFSELKNGAPNEYPLEFLITGEKFEVLKELAQELEKLFKETPGVINIKNPMSLDKTELEVELNRKKANLLKISYLNFDQTIRTCVAGVQVGEVTLEDGEDYPLKIRMRNSGDFKIPDFDKVYFDSPVGGKIPFRQIADLQFQSSSPEILHTNLVSHTSLQANVLNPDQSIPITQKIMEKLPSIKLPPGYEIIVKGEYEKQKKTFGNLGVILILAQIGIFAVLVLQFRSILQPIAVFSAVPFAVSGSFIALYLAGWSFSFFAFVGFISLIGIVVNNSIIMVDYINQLRSNGMERLEAIVAGSERRLVPVVLTTITTILGLIPLTLSFSTVWTPVGLTIIGGMVSSTLMTLILVPVLYKWLTK